MQFDIFSQKMLQMNASPEISPKLNQTISLKNDQQEIFCQNDDTVIATLTLWALEFFAKRL